MAHAKAPANPNDFILPDLGEGVHEAELIAWKVEVGQTVEEHQILAEMETDKALVEVPSPRAGTIAALHGKPGEILHVGNPLVSYTGGAAAAEPAPKSKKQADTGCDMKVHAPTAPAAGTSSNGHPPTSESEDAGTVVGSMGGSLGGISSEGKALATPAVRRLARDLGIDINSIRGTGIGGRVTEKDVRSGGSGGTGLRPVSSASSTSRGHSDVAPMDPAEPHSGAMPAMRVASTPTRHASPTPQTRQAPAIPPGQESVRIPFRGVRRTIANRLRQSVNQAVHFNVMDEADVTALDALRKKLAAASGEKVSFLPFVASAACRVLSDSRFRALNATVEEPGGAGFQPAKGEEAESFIIQHRAVHLGIATDTESGLMVPVIRDADALGVLEIGRHIAGIAAAARTRSIPREQLIGSTFTISNVGSHAGRFATPIINYPEAAILAVGRARPAPVIRTVQGAPCFAIGQLLPLSLACDHRVVDGATAALALAEIIKLLQEPESVLAPARG
jgi:pyruvate dehydrogenase E2 component (dihydrolipoamide acetyltransferase)